MTTDPGAGKTTGVPSTVEHWLTAALATKMVGPERGVVEEEEMSERRERRGRGRDEREVE